MRARTTVGWACAALLGCGIPHAGDARDARGDASVDAGDVAVDRVTDGGADAWESHPACESAIDLNAMGMTVSADGGIASVRWTGDNTDAPEGVSRALQPTPGACDFRAVKQRMFRYRLRGDAALRVSTNNPGSDRAFDSAVFVTTAPCGPAARVLACNDDDPFAMRPPHVTLSLATTSGLRAGAEVYISVSGFYPAPGAPQSPNPAGEVGMFELSVTEVPSRAVNEPCDTSGRADGCVLGAHCIADDLGRGRCLRDGSQPGALCGPESLCDAPLSCDTQRNTCFAVAAQSGAVCEVGASANRCGDGLTCVAPLRGQRRGACTRNGSLMAACVASEGGITSCGEGLRCVNGQCRRAIADGAPCNLFTDACPAGRSCVASDANGGAGTCVANGTAHNSACREGASECDAPLFCIVNAARERTCRTVGEASGARCDNGGVCSFDNPCVVSDPSRPSEGVCRAPGETGTACAADMGCTGGRRCVGRTANALGRCLPLLAAGAACDPEGRTDACVTGHSCVRRGDGSAACVPHGSAPGAACRSASPACDGALSCASDRGGRCVASAGRGEPCDPRFNTVRCGAGTFCGARTFDRGLCEEASVESEPNDSIATAIAGGEGITARGALARFDVDCASVRVPEGGSFFAQTVGLNGQCVNNLVLDLYRSDGTWIGTDFDAGPSSCPRIDGRVQPWAQGLSMGSYVVCVREANNGIVGGYLLSARAVSAP
jgi:hypothetical protein